ncbi:hypothetical protein ABKV19_023909 [Rosa sericea]
MATISLKLLVDTKQKKVLFAEAGKEFVDFLFTLLSFPAGTIIRLLSKDNMVGSLGLLTNVEKPERKSTYICSNTENVVWRGSYSGYSDIHPYCSDDPKAKCPKCSHNMSISTTYVAPPTAPAEEASAASKRIGFVKPVVTYMIMDDLEVKPMSTISTIALLNSLNVRDFGALEEKVVNLGMDEGVKLLKESLQSKSVLTNVFLKGVKHEDHSSAN